MGWKIKIAFLNMLVTAIFADMKLEQIAPPQAASLSMIDRALHAMLEDSSCFSIKIMPEKRSRYFSEWIYDVKPVEWQLSSDFFCDPAKWSGFYELELYSVFDTPFPGYDYVLKNTHNGQMVFAKMQPFQSVLIPKTLFAERYFSNLCKEESPIAVSYFQNTSVIGLEDNRFFKLLPTNYRFRTFWEWMTDEQIEQPDDNFVFNFQDFKIKDQIQVFSGADHPEYLRSRTPKNFSRVYLIVNQANGKMAYAQAYSLKELIFDFEQKISSAQQQGYDQGYQKGYKQGYQNGYAQGKKDENSALNRTLPNRNIPPQPAPTAPSYHDYHNPLNNIEDEDPS